MRPIAVLLKHHDTYLICYLSFRISVDDTRLEFKNFTKGTPEDTDLKLLNKPGNFLLGRLCSLPGLEGFYVDRFQLAIYFEKDGDLEKLLPKITHAIKIIAPQELKEDGSVFYSLRENVTKI